VFFPGPNPRMQHGKLAITTSRSLSFTNGF
jgi:hypothetical protein